MRLDLDMTTDRSILPAGAAESVRRWLGESWSARPLAGDASVRAYYRIERDDGSTFVLTWYPEEVRSQMKRFLDAYRAVSKHAYVPRVIEYDEAAMLQQDVGDRTLFDLLQEERAEGIRWYRKAITLLVYFQKAGEVGINEPFTAEFFANELEMSREYYAERLMGLTRDRSLALRPILRNLAENISRHPYVLCHRDYHGQNIHIFKDKLYLLDYQDMRSGPDTYDLASLLRDRGVARILGDETELGLVDYYSDWRVHGFPARSPLPEGERRSMRRRYFETLLQRSIKILGTFARQPIERGLLRYLAFIPHALESVRRCLDELPEYGALSTLLPMEFSIEEARARVERMRHGSTHDHAPAR
ncbi:MAG TPA: phosphotransferase [Thermoanaerobaculia bacterium]|nr:phosphotransferase [Thermoanaerobaculia bacterium]